MAKKFDLKEHLKLTPVDDPDYKKWENLLLRIHAADHFSESFFLGRKVKGEPIDLHSIVESFVEQYDLAAGALVGFVKDRQSADACFKERSFRVLSG